MIRSNFPRFSQQVADRIRTSRCTCSECERKLTLGSLCMWVLICAFYAYIFLQIFTT